MISTTLLQRILISLGMITLFGILVHDTKFDKAFVLSLPFAATLVAASGSVDFAGNAHTHVERTSLKHSLSNIPRIPPRDDHRRFAAQKFHNRNSTPFGDSLLFQPA